MTYDEKVKKILEQRGTALLGLDGVIKSEVSLTDEKNLNDRYLFGDLTDISPLNLLEMYYKEMNISVGRTSSSPALQGGLGSSESSWKARLSSAITLSGDGSIYPDSNGDGIADNEAELSSVWFTTNSDNSEMVSASSIYNQLTSPIAPAIGTAASQTANARTNGQTYSDESAASSAALSKAASERGSALKGRRTQNSDENHTPVLESTTSSGTNEITIIETTTDGTDPETGDPITITDYTFEIGANGQDHIHYYTGTERTNFENVLTNLRNGLRDEYKPHVQNILSELNKINNGENELFESAGMDEQEILNDITNINNLISTLDDYINDLDLQIEYFSGFTSSEDLTGQSTTVNGIVTTYSKVDFDDRLDNQIPTLISNIISTLTSRVTQIEGVISLGDATKSIRKWILFWVIENIGKPSAPMIGLKGISEAFAQAEAGIKKANNSTKVLFGTNRNLYITTPNNVYTYQDNQFDDNTGEIVKRKNAFGWVGPVYCNMFKIYRKKLNRSVETPSNENWTDVNLYDVKVEINPDSGIINQIYIDQNIEIEQGDVYIYRVSGFDTNEVVTIVKENIEEDKSPQKAMLDTYDNLPSGSNQSRVYDDDNLFTFSNMKNGVFAFVVPEGAEHDFSNNDYIAIVNSSGTDGFYKIESITGNEITLYNKDLNFSRGEIAKAFGILEITN